MTKYIKNVMRGIGSIMDIAPSTDYTKFVPKKNGNERMRKRWARVGQHIQHSIILFDYEQKKAK